MKPGALLIRPHRAPKSPQVLLIHNISVPHGLANGRLGVVEKFIQCSQAMGLNPGWQPTGTALVSLALDTWLNANGPEPPLMPVVRFPGAGHAVVVMPHLWTIAREGRVTCWRVQIPLLLAFAMTVHNFQDKLRIVGYDPSNPALMADPRVVEFYKRLRAEREGEDI
ncbi:hypothetical protein BDK51DRAFT_50059 [Blyttiomyces helicus]|uniref:Uncharacterized protein n=1 Tax=Blyttiomyces helicus TaxID=388810 RepID=A0A4P9WPD4_9FUNG|nr:hypothetical protein BDK51DRAFT_50059 [Blyttiomyces helicus]|eukprot:RKO93598.1 hypothetical protein BDK51DRAFT_50059 [Blyttiomyces helicus]